MMEHEPFEEGNLTDRLIPEIPGVVSSSNLNFDEGDLTEEIEEDSEEDILEGISREIRSFLQAFGIEGLNGVPQEDVIRLWERMGMSNYLIADLALYSTIDISETLKDMYRRPRFSDLRERSEIAENPYDIRIKLVEELAPGLSRLGYGEGKTFKLLRANNERLALAFKSLSWLTGLSFMSDLPAQIKSERASTRENKLTRSQVFSIARNEIIRQGRIAESYEFKKQYNPRLSSSVEAYDKHLRTIKIAYKIAEIAFEPFI